MNQNIVEFMYLKNKFPKSSDVEMKEEVFVGSHIRELIKQVKCEDQQCEVDKAEWESLQKNHYQFFGKSQGRKLS